MGGKRGNMAALSGKAHAETWVAKKGDVGHSHWITS